MEHRFYTLDVFTHNRFEGNPLAVFTDGDGLSDDQMLAIAREMNLSETVFVQKPTEEEALIVRKALSGVARMSAKIDGEWQPRFGRGRIVQTLVGSRSQELLNAQLDRLSTHGLLKSEGVAYLNQLLRDWPRHWEFRRETSTQNCNLRLCPPASST